uniref:Uncharacterized protein n=1 Tax=Candidatus Kentrum sp. FW TaxID=2126338 RepID=A0A450TJN2_9GAMM|nr:MAG: hypothetical protein BECKFW1821B_GA0114236_11323 [Candidatus Kentron sp. FW]
MPISLFETRTMLEALEEMKAPRTFLIQSFFSNVETFATELVDIDIVKPPCVTFPGRPLTS